MTKPTSQWYTKPSIWLLIWLLLLTGCASETPVPVEELIQPTPSPTAKPTGRGAGGTLHLLYWDAPTILNPHLTPSIKDLEVSRITYEPLASYNREGNLVPFLAAEIPSLDNGDVAQDGRSVTWRLKQDIKWSDGAPFTAADVQFTYEFITNPEVGSFSTSAYNAIDKVEVIDDYTVKVIFKDANPAWSAPFVGAVGIILPKHKFEAFNGSNASDAPANIEPVGTGPYHVLSPGIKPQEIIFLGTQLIQTNKIVFEPNPYFRDPEKPYFSRLEVRGGGTAKEAARQVLQTGEAHYAWNLALPSEELAIFEAHNIGEVTANFGSTVDEIDINQTNPRRATSEGEYSSLKFPHPFFSDLKVRQAFAHAIDREAIVKLYGLGGEITHHIFVTPPQYRSDKIFYEFDLDKAAELLDEAGWVDSDEDDIRDKDGVKMSVLFQTTASPIRQATQRIIQQDLEAIEVDVELKIIDASIFYGSDTTHPDNAQQFRADMQEQDWTATSPEPGLFFQFWTCDQVTQQANNWSGFNNPRWCNEDYDALYAEAQMTLDPKIRTEIFVQMNDLLTKDVAMIPLVRQARIAAINRQLQNFEPTPWDAETWNIKDWKMNEEQ